MANTVSKINNIEIFSRITFQDKLLFTKHLDTMIKAGIPIAEALETLVEQSKSTAFKKIISSILKDVGNGQSLAKSMKKHKKVFDEFYISLIEVGEESGTLDETLEFLAVQLSKEFRLKKKIKGALMYPIIVIVATFTIGGFIAIFVLPKLVEFFESFDAGLPITTRILLFIANITKQYGVFLFIGFFVAIFLLRFILNTKFIKPHWHALTLKLPLVGNLISYGQLAQFSRNFGTLIKSGVPIARSLEITAETLTNIKFKNDLFLINTDLTKGKNIGDSLRTHKFSEYPPLVSSMVSIGEKTGRLDETLLYLAGFYEDEIDDLSKNISTIIEPVLLLFIGLAVGFLALSIISPIYELTGSIRR